MEEGVDSLHERRNLAQHKVRDSGLFEQAFRHRELDRVAGFEDFNQLEPGVERVRQWGSLSGQQSSVTVGAFGETVAVFRAALWTVHDAPLASSLAPP
jgi:hypothetical protein